MNLRLGIFLLAITPTAISSVIMVDLIKGHKELIISQVVLYNMLSPLTYSILLQVFFNTTGLTIPTKLIFFKLTTMIFIPFLLSLIARKFIKLKTKLLNISEIASPIAFIFVIGVAVSSASLNLKEIGIMNLLMITLFVFTLAVILFLIGFNLSKKIKIKKSLGMAFSYRNGTLTTWVALTNFAPPVVIPMIIYIVIHHAINGFLIHKYGDH